MRYVLNQLEMNKNEKSTGDGRVKKEELSSIEKNKLVESITKILESDPLFLQYPKDILSRDVATFVKNSSDDLKSVRAALINTATYYQER